MKMIRKFSGQELFIMITAVFALMFMYSSILFSGGEIDQEDMTNTIAQEYELVNNEQEPLSNGEVIKAGQLDALDKDESTKEIENLYAYAYEQKDKQNDK